MTDDRNDDVLDTRIRSLVATAVADAPPAPVIDQTTVRSSDGDDDRSPNRWIAGGLAGLSVAAAIVALFFISRPDEVTAPVAPATVPATLPATVPAPLDEQTEDAVVEADSPAPLGSAAQVLYLSDAGVVGVDVDGLERTLTTEAMATAVLTDDGRIFAQRATGTVPVFAPAIVAIDQETAEITRADTPTEFDGRTPFLHDGATIDGEAVVLLTLRPEACPVAASCVGELVAWWPDTGEVRVIARRNVFEGAWRLPTLADNGLVVGIELESATHGFFAAVVPDVPGVADVDVPSAAELGLEAFYVDCDVCPNGFTTDATGRIVAWLETDRASGDLTIVMRSVEQSVERSIRVPVSGFGGDGPPSSSRSQLLMPFTGFDLETGGPFGSFALASAVFGQGSGAWFGTLLSGEVVPLDSVERIVFP